VVVNYLFVGMAAWLVRTGGLYRPYAIWQPLEPPHGPTIAQFARLGIPAGLAIMVEVTSFTLMALFIARQGTLSAAAHQIAANLAAVMYMVPLSIGIATSARVSFWLGAGDAKKARASIRTGFRMGLSLALVLALVVLLARSGIASLYSADRQVTGVAAGLLALVALYHFGDAMQALCVFVLRSYRVAAVGRRRGGRLPAGLPRTGPVAGAAESRRLLGGEQLRARPARPHPAADSLAGRAPFPAGVISSGRTRDAGSTMLKLEPAPGVLAIFSSPPCRCTTCLTIARPSPVPPVSRERLRSTR
jgi:hypothetical protein